MSSEHPADLQVVGSIGARFRVERRVGRPVPVGDAPRRRLEPLGDRAEAVARDDRVREERRLRGRRRPHEGRCRGRTGRRRLGRGGRRRAGRRAGIRLVGSGTQAATITTMSRTPVQLPGDAHFAHGDASSADAVTTVRPPAAPPSRPGSVAGATARRQARGPRRRSRSCPGRRAWRRSRRGRPPAGSSVAVAPSSGNVATPIDAVTVPSGGRPRRRRARSATWRAPGRVGAGEQERELVAAVAEDEVGVAAGAHEARPRSGAAADRRPGGRGRC